MGKYSKASSPPGTHDVQDDDASQGSEQSASPSDSSPGAAVQASLRSFKCKECSKSFESEGKLERHSRRYHHSRRFSCHHCNRSFVRSDHFRYHLQSHSDFKPHECATCGHFYLHFASLQRHQQQSKHKGHILHKAPPARAVTFKAGDASPTHAAAPVGPSAKQASHGQASEQMQAAMAPQMTSMPMHPSLQMQLQIQLQMQMQQMQMNAARQHQQPPPSFMPMGAMPMNAMAMPMQFLPQGMYMVPSSQMQMHSSQASFQHAGGVAVPMPVCVPGLAKQA